MKLLPIAFLFVFCTFGQADDWSQHMQAHQSQLPANSGNNGLVGMAVTGLAAFTAGSLFPIRFKKSGESLESLRKTVAAKNVEIQKLKTMAYEYEFQIAELKKALFQSEQDALKRDYEEFKQPDANGDDVISRMEFATYIRNYMKAYPHIPVEDYPTFDDFDMNRDGLVTFQEWQEYLYQQQLAEEQGTQLSGKGSQNAASSMYDLSSNSGDFQSLYDQLQQQVRTMK